MARYQYETSPRKIETRYKNVPNKKKLEVIKNDQKKNNGISKKEHERRKSQLCSVLVIFALLVVISYRNSLITEEFKVILFSISFTVIMAAVFKVGALAGRASPIL